MRKLQGVTVAKLEAAAMESLTAWFEEKPRNAEKRPILNELFKIAKMEERYKRDEIGMLLSRLCRDSVGVKLVCQRRRHHPSLRYGGRYGHGVLL
jgi:hypothetical protein